MFNDPDCQSCWDLRWNYKFGFCSSSLRQALDCGQLCMQIFHIGGPQSERKSKEKHGLGLTNYPARTVASGPRLLPSWHHLHIMMLAVPECQIWSRQEASTLSRFTNLIVGRSCCKHHRIAGTQGFRQKGSFVRDFILKSVRQRGLDIAQHPQLPVGNVLACTRTQRQRFGRTSIKWQRWCVLSGTPNTTVEQRHLR